MDRTSGDGRRNGARGIVAAFVRRSSQRPRTVALREAGAVRPPNFRRCFCRVTVVSVAPNNYDAPMKNLTLALTSALILTAGSLQAMDVKIVSGDLSFLKGQKVLNVEYTFDNLRVSKMSEAEFVQKKTSDYNAKSPGKGDRWAEAWTADRDRVYKGKFEELFNKMVRDRKMDLVLKPKATDAKYTLILKTTFMDVGYNVWISRKPAFLDADAVFVETADPTKVVATVAIKKSPGRNVMGDDYYESTRLGEAYAKAGKELGILVFKKAGK